MKQRHFGTVLRLIIYSVLIISGIALISCNVADNSPSTSASPTQYAEYIAIRLKTTDKKPASKQLASFAAGEAHGELGYRNFKHERTPSGFCVTHDGYIAILDTENSRIEIFKDGTYHASYQYQDSYYRHIAYNGTNFFVLGKDLIVIDNDGELVAKLGQDKMFGYDVYSEKCCLLFNGQNQLVILFPDINVSYVYRNDKLEFEKPGQYIENYCILYQPDTVWTITSEQSDIYDIVGSFGGNLYVYNFPYDGKYDYQGYYFQKYDDVGNLIWSFDLDDTDVFNSDFLHCESFFVLRFEDDRYTLYKFE